MYKPCRCFTEVPHNLGPAVQMCALARHHETLVLQGIGLPLEEAMKFWRAEFGPKCAGEVSRRPPSFCCRCPCAPPTLSTCTAHVIGAQEFSY